MTKRRMRGTGSVYEQDGHWMCAVSQPSLTGVRRRQSRVAQPVYEQRRVEYSPETTVTEVRRLKKMVEAALEQVTSA